MAFQMYPTIVTPFTYDNKIDYSCLEKLICLFAKCDVDGVFAVCQSSEMFFLNDDEKIELAKFSIDVCRRNNLKCVVSGHTQDRIEDQISYLKRLEQLKPDAIILINNRFAKENEPENVCIKNFNTVVGSLQPETPLGIYECPYPYKRLISNDLLDSMLSDGRFHFIKDTCCRIELIKERIKAIENSNVKLYNANAATLFESILTGAAGYSGVMLNFMPEHFAILKKSFIEGSNHISNQAPEEDSAASIIKNQKYLVRARAVSEVISAASVIECQNYPANAKYLLVKRGIFSTYTTRNGKPVLTESQMKELDAFVSQLERTKYLLSPHAEITRVFSNGTFFHSSHASSILTLEDGTVVIVYFAGSYEKADDVGIWMSRYANDMWEPPKRIAKVNNTAHWNPVIYQIPGGIRVTFKVGRHIPDWDSWHIESYDRGKTWSSPTPYGGAVGPVRSKPIYLSNGILLAPNSTETAESWLPRVDVSYDNGATYSKYSNIPINRIEASDDKTYISGLGAIQPTLWESSPGKVHALLRTTCGYIYRSDSNDYGKTWCTAYSTGLPNNNSGIDVTYTKNCLYLVMNPISGNWASRTPLVLMKSTDNGESFQLQKVLADTVFDDGNLYPETHTAEFSYPSITEKNNSLYISFTYNRTGIAFAIETI